MLLALAQQSHKCAERHVCAEKSGAGLTPAAALAHKWQWGAPVSHSSACQVFPAQGLCGVGKKEGGQNRAGGGVQS